MTQTQEAARHSCGFFIAQHGRLIPPGVWEHPCEQIRAIRRRELSAPPSWRERVRRLVPRPRVRAERENDEQ